MKQTILIKNIIKTVILIYSITYITTVSSANNAHITTASNSDQKTLHAAFQIIEPVIVLNKQMIKSVKLAAFDNIYGRVELTLTPEASGQLSAIGKLKKNQKLVFTINNQISDAFFITQKTMSENSFTISITTSRKNADLIMKIFS